MTKCKKCGFHHFGISCPDIQEINYYADGSIKRITYYPTFEKRLDREVEIRVQAELKKREIKK